MKLKLLENKIKPPIKIGTKVKIKRYSRDYEPAVECEVDLIYLFHSPHYHGAKFYARAVPLEKDRYYLIYLGGIRKRNYSAVYVALDAEDASAYIMSLLEDWNLDMEAYWRIATIQ